MNRPAFSEETILSVVRATLANARANLTALVEFGVTDARLDQFAAAITALFSSTESSDMTFEKYYVALEGISLIRLDIMGWKRTITASSLTTKVEQVSALCQSQQSILRRLTSIPFWISTKMLSQLTIQMQRRST